MSATPLPFHDESPFGEDLERPTAPKGRNWGVKKVLDPYGNSGGKKRKADFNKLQREWFECGNWTYARVEKPNAFGSVTTDLWGFADYLACHPSQGIALFQVTSKGNELAHVRKILAAPEFAKWLEAGGKVFLSLWEQPGGKGSKWLSAHRLMDEATISEFKARMRKK